MLQIRLNKIFGSTVFFGVVLGCSVTLSQGLNRFSWISWVVVILALLTYLLFTLGLISKNFKLKEFFYEIANVDLLARVFFSQPAILIFAIISASQQKNGLYELSIVIFVALSFISIFENLKDISQWSKESESLFGVGFQSLLLLYLTLHSLSFFAVANPILSVLTSLLLSVFAWAGVQYENFSKNMILIALTFMLSIFIINFKIFESARIFAPLYIIIVTTIVANIFAEPIRLNLRLIRNIFAIILATLIFIVL